MAEWNEGYQSDIGYTYGYYPELNPLHVRLAFLSAGLKFPEVGTACELGFGQGLSTAIHGAASMVEWHGTDFIPAQADIALEFGKASGGAVHLHDQSFAEFCNRTDLPDFDFVAMHGIWSWVSDDNRRVIVDFLRRKLKVGGVVYISSNTPAGWAAMVPMRQLLTQHAEVMSASGQGILPRIDAAFNFAERLLATNPLFAQANPSMGPRLAKVRASSRNYVAHEYFNRDWALMPFPDLVQWLTPAKLNHACSAHYLDLVEGINLTPAQRALLAEIPDPAFREMTRDLMVNQVFRRDYWVKGPRKLNPVQRGELMREQRVVLAQSPAEMAKKVTTSLGEAELQGAVYGPLLEVLARQPVVTLGQIEQALAARKLGMAQILEAVLVLGGIGALAAAQDPGVTAKVTARTRQFNQYLCMQGRGSSEINHLASPVTGGGIVVTRFRQLLLLAMAQGKKTPHEWAQYAWSIAAAQGGKITKNGVTLESAEENIAEMTEQAKEFAATQLPVLKTLGVV